MSSVFDLLYAKYDNVIGVSCESRNNSAECFQFIEGVHVVCVWFTCRSQKLEEIMKDLWPTPYLWLLIVCHLVVFVVGLMGNALVCIAVLRNHTMRTVTNIFIVNLAVADFLVLLFCLPPTVTVDVTQTWFFGSVACKVITSLQWMSAAVSVLTLTVISLDRWYAMCHPLRFLATARWAKKAIAVIWGVSIAISIPYMVWSEVHALPWSPKGTVYYSSCAPTWVGWELHAVVASFVGLYLLPLCFMVFTYSQIVRALWRRAIPGQLATADCPLAAGRTGDQGGLMSHSSEAVCTHVRARRKAAKMLVVVVVVFAICLLFVHAFMVIRSALGSEGWQRVPGLVAQASVSISHWLFYFNSAINPIIYNFMSSRFRREFRKAMCRPWWSPLGLPADDSRAQHANSSLSRRRNNTVTRTTSSSRHLRRLLTGRQPANGTCAETRL
ncbi:orexin receptor type 2-like [Pollicipes pollicipes]|uniref:orexin receptor type 2-like n=1 Tax=Pollicipes pollicipes TaxID=41117 RepID=UPI001884CA81|nr:orexin receptor type 2-like [Pollicipes pollicipes]